MYSYSVCCMSESVFGLYPKKKSTNSNTLDTPERELTSIKCESTCDRPTKIERRLNIIEATSKMRRHTETPKPDNLVLRMD
ncbi:hypothetical protein VNO77_25558 [Canavalia gladiata]|uniref:Uncharacterized protein n=1 Tax=Canavalia gladiata TaxID=3824 RepID=A0AAN9L8X6_CANGL